MGHMKVTTCGMNWCSAQTVTEAPTNHTAQPLSSMKNVKGIGGVAGVIGGVNSAIENVGKMCKSIKHGPTVGLYVINLASNISYIAAGVLGLLSLAGAMTVLPWVLWKLKL